MNYQSTFPDISVIIPVHNSERYLRKCLDSVVKQTFSNFEVIVIDDGSDDNSFFIMKEYAKKYEKFRLFRIEKSGVSEARNIGVKESRGKYLSFIDSDDFVLPNFLEILYNGIKRYNTDISCCNYYLYWPERNFHIRDIMCLSSGVYSSGRIIRSLIKDVRIHFFLWNKLWKKSLFTDNNIKFPDGRCYEDIYVCLEAFYFSNNVSVTSEPLYFYTRRKDSYENSMDLKKYRDYIEAFKYMRIFLDLKGKYSKYRMSHRILGMRIILSSIPMLLSVWCGTRNVKNFFHEFKLTVKSIFYCIGNKFDIKSELRDGKI